MSDGGFQVAVKTLQDAVIAFNRLTQQVANVPSTIWNSFKTVPLTSAANIPLDLSTGFNFEIPLATNATMGNPTNAKPGQSGSIYITQQSPGSFTLAYASNWHFAGGTTPVLSTTSGALDVLYYKVMSPTFVIGNLVKAVS